MKVNSKKETYVANGIKLANVIPGLILGLAFIAVGLYLAIAKPLDDNGNPPGFVIPGAAIGVGTLVVLISIFQIIRAIRAMKRKPLSAAEAQANAARYDAARSDTPVELSDTTIVSKMVGHLQPGLSFEDRNGKKLYEIKLKKFRVVGSDEYEFIDSVNHTSKILKIGKLMDEETGAFGLDVILSSRFQIDGVMSWDYLRNRGYRVEHHMFEHHFNSYQLFQNDTLVASLIQANAKDPWNPEKKSVLGMQEGCYRIEISKARLEDVAMAAFIVFKSNIVE